MNIKKEDFDYLIKMAILGADEVCGYDKYVYHHEKIYDMVKKYE